MWTKALGSNAKISLAVCGQKFGALTAKYLSPYVDKKLWVLTAEYLSPYVENSFNTK